MNNKNNRREFLKKTTLFAFAVSTPVLNSCRGDNPAKTPEETCVTTPDILGPFYKAGAPFKEDISASSSATPLIMEGRVLKDCDTVLPGAIVEIWNADENGSYDISTEFKFRGQCQTQQNGMYRFKTIIPGRYLNGNTYRPSHIHFRITAPGYGELVSQVYFKDDPFINGDPWASTAKASERILIVKRNIDGMDTVNFDIYLKPV